MNRDKFTNANPRECAEATFACIDRLQAYPPETQLVAASALFLLLADVLQVRAPDAFTIVTNIINNDNNRMCQEFRAVKSYLQNEVVPKR